MGIRFDPDLNEDGFVTPVYYDDPEVVFIVVDDEGRPRSVWFDEDQAHDAVKSDDEASTYIEMECG